MRKLRLFFIAVLTIGALLFFGQNHIPPALTQTFPTPTIFQYTGKQVLQSAVSPSFYPLAPCPSCSSPSIAPIGGSAMPSYPASQPSISSAPMDPCDSSSSSLASDKKKKKKSKHKKHEGGISKGIEAFFKFLIELLNLILKLFGGGEIKVPQTPGPGPTDSPDVEVPEPEDPTDSEPSQAPDGDEGDPCDDENEPSRAPQPSQPAQPSSAQPQPSTIVPSGGAPSGTPGTQTLGCGGIPAPANAEKPTSTGPLNITTGGTAGNPKVYDGACTQVGTITIKADYVTVQNFKIVAGGQYGVNSEGTGITIQNNDIKGVKASGDGDLNAITFFGNDTKILYNTAIDFVEGSPGGSHTDAIQTWISSSHPTGSTNVIIKGNKFSGPANPSRDNNIPSIHQCIMAEGPGRGGNSGGSGTSSNWLIADNYFGDSWNQCIKLDGIDNVTVTRNEFAGSSDKIMDVPLAPGFKYFSDNKVTGQYKNGVGAPVTQGAGPASL